MRSRLRTLKNNKITSWVRIGFPWVNPKPTHSPFSSHLPRPNHHHPTTSIPPSSIPPYSDHQPLLLLTTIAASPPLRFSPTK
uniref:Uncharacterized protein n=1 Tax=Helianthus annuus TaxID=4232 RepID=A0A251TFL6_HELAN